MRNLKKLLLLTVVFTLLVAVTVPAFSAASFSYEAEAQTLHSLGLYSGVSTTTYDPDLGAALNRETGVVMLLRMFGLEAEASALTDAEVNTALARFSDAASISSWAKKSIAYAVTNGLVIGFPDGTFAPKANLVGKQYCTLILRQLGYTPNYHAAADELADVGGLTTTQAIVFSGKALIKDDLVGISFGSLSAVDTEGVPVIVNLVKDGVVDESVAVDSGLMDSEIAAAAEAAVAAYEAAPITTLDEIAAAEALGVTASDAVAVVADAHAKAILEEKITAKKAKVDAAKAVLTSDNDNDNDNDNVTVTATATGAKKLTATFNRAVDSVKAVFTVKKGSITVSQSSVAFAGDDKSAVITLTSKLSKGNYTISVAGVTGLGGEAIAGSVSVEDEKVGKIEFTSATALIDRTDITKVTAAYKVSNQYGEDISSNDPALNFASSVGTPAGGDGTLVIDAASEFHADDKIVVSAVDAVTGTFASAVLTVAAKSQVAEVIIEKLINTNNEDTALAVGGIAEDFKLVMSFKDQYGNSMNSEGLLAAIKEDTVFVISGTSVVIDTDDPNIAIEKIDGVDKVVLPLASIECDGTATLTVISKITSALYKFDIVVNDERKVDILTLSAPDLAVAGESFNIPFSAVDQYGIPITTASSLIFVEGVTSMSVADEEEDYTASIEFKQDNVNGTAYLEVNAEDLTDTQTLIITAITGTGKPVQLSFILEAPAVPTFIFGIRNFTSNIAKNETSSLDEDDVIVKDQYEREDDVFGSAGYSIVVKTSGSHNVTLGEVTAFTAEDGTAVTFTGAIEGIDEITIMLQKDGIDVGDSEYTFDFHVS